MNTLRRLARRLLDPPRASAYHVDSADGFRVFCVLIIMWFHIWQQSWLTPAVTIGGHYLSIEPQVRAGYLMVDLMLMLSGFLLFLPFARHVVSGEKLPNVKRFYQKRALRILPSYYLCVFAVLFLFALPQGQFSSPKQLWLDLTTHLTFTHNFFYETYIATRLNVALWTLAVEVQFYLIFPLLGRAFAKKPVVTYVAMVMAALAYRGWIVPMHSDISIYFNRLPGMLDVYANGMMASLIYVSLTERLKEDRYTGLFFTVIALLSGCAVWQIFRQHLNTAQMIGTQPAQMAWRFRLSLCGAVFLVSAGHASGWLRMLLNNRVMRFFSAISFNVYMWHQYLACRLKDWHIPPYRAESMPQMAGEQPWQTQYTWLCFLAAIALATLLTYGFEKPVCRLGERLMNRKKKNRRTAG